MCLGDDRDRTPAGRFAFPLRSAASSASSRRSASCRARGSFPLSVSLDHVGPLREVRRGRAVDLRGPPRRDRVARRRRRDAAKRRAAIGRCRARYFLERLQDRGARQLRVARSSACARPAFSSMTSASPHAADAPTIYLPICLREGLRGARRARSTRCPSAIRRRCASGSSWGATSRRRKRRARASPREEYARRRRRGAGRSRRARPADAAHRRAAARRRDRADGDGRRAGPERHAAADPAVQPVASSGRSRCRSPLHRRACRSVCSSSAATPRACSKLLPWLKRAAGPLKYQVPCSPPASAGGVSILNASVSAFSLLGTPHPRRYARPGRPALRMGPRVVGSAC